MAILVLAVVGDITTQIAMELPIILTAEVSLITLAEG